MSIHARAVFFRTVPLAMDQHIDPEAMAESKDPRMTTTKASGFTSPFGIRSGDLLWEITETLVSGGTFQSQRPSPYIFESTGIFESTNEGGYGLS